MAVIIKDSHWNPKIIKIPISEYKLLFFILNLIVRNFVYCCKLIEKKYDGNSSVLWSHPVLFVRKHFVFL